MITFSQCFQTKIASVVTHSLYFWPRRFERQIYPWRPFRKIHHCQWIGSACVVWFFGVKITCGYKSHHTNMTGLLASQVTIFICLDWLVWIYFISHHFPAQRVTLYATQMVSGRRITSVNTCENGTTLVIGVLGVSSIIFYNCTLVYHKVQTNCSNWYLTFTTCIMVKMGKVSLYLS